jgi:MutS domain V
MSPREEYAERLDARRTQLISRNRLERRLADARLFVFATGLVVLALAFWLGLISWVWVLPLLVVFVLLVVIHARISLASKRVARAVAYYETGLKRIDGQWAGTGVAGTAFLDPEHPYSADLDLFGTGSLFERLCTARTRSGEEQLAAWLLGPADPATVRARQAAVTELRPKLDFREAVAVLGADVREGIDPEGLTTWAAEPTVFTTRWPGVVAPVLAALALMALWAWIATDLGSPPFVLVAIVELAFALTQRRKVQRVLKSVHRRAHDLIVIAELLSRLETETFKAPLLARLADSLRTGGEPASKRVSRLAQLLNRIDWGENQVFAPFAAILLWKTQLARRVDAWRTRTGPEIAGWLAAVGEFEALESLAAFAFENPDDPFPEVTDGPAHFEGEGLGHPLIAPSSCVRNDVRLGGDLRVLLVSGSNMSGKSTLLRTVGVNAVLALAGAPVHATSLRLSVLALGATLRVQDSLQAGRSRFYAELTRIRTLVNIAGGATPLLFLLDEVFHGTNSHDRTVGAEAVIRGLLDRGAIGLVTTHDLALAAVADRLAPRALNVHFEDQLVGDTLHFDFKMRPGIVTHSNALALMRAVGLDV